MSMIKWPEIESFHHVRKELLEYPELLGGRTTVGYRCKVKLHGTNAAVQVRPNGNVVCQSRTSLIAPGSDNLGFAAWVQSQHAAWAKILCDGLPDDLGDTFRGIVVFGEWFGPGIQKGVACSRIPDKHFAVFAAAPIQSGDERRDELVVEPDDLREILTVGGSMHARTLVIPWFGDVRIEVPWLEEGKVLEPIVEGINRHVAGIDALDPLIRDQFDVEGPGEGLVFYPTTHPGRKHFSDLCFKAKGERHKTVAKDRPAQVDPSVAASLVEFADLVLTPARLEQGVRAVNRGDLVFDMRMMGPVLQWIVADVRKECGPEIEASGLDERSALKAVMARAREWYCAQSRKL